MSGPRLQLAPALHARLCLVLTRLTPAPSWSVVMAFLSVCLSARTLSSHGEATVAIENPPTVAGRPH